MIARHEGARPDDVWSKIAAPLDPSVVQWRQQGKAKQREGKYFAPFVAYIDAQIVRERLDAIVAGEWDLTLEPLPNVVFGTGEEADEPFAFKARLQILNVIREDVGMGRDYKNASTDSFKRAAVRFGIGHELYTDYEVIWVQVDGDGKYAKAMEDPATVYARKQGKASEGEQRARPTSSGNGNVAASSTPRSAPAPTTTSSTARPATTTTSAAEVEPICPKCSGPLWDNRVSKRNPKAPDWKCRSRSCDGVIWPVRGTNAEPRDEDGPPEYDGPELEDLKELPF